MLNMKIPIIAILLALALVGCATPVVMLKNESTGQIVRCGGGVGGFIAGGLIGQSIEKSADEACVRDFEARGFRRTGAVRDAPAPPRQSMPVPATLLATPP